MPAAFIRCTNKDDSTVWTEKGPSKLANLKKGEKRVVCIDPDTGEMHFGEKEKIKEDGSGS